MKLILWLSIGLVVCGAVVLALWSAIGLQTEPPFVVGPSLPAGKVAPRVAGTWDSGYLLAPEGSLWAWGGTQFGKADIQNPGRSEIPRRVGTNSDWVKFAASWNHVLALKADHSLWGWGNNSSGELATNSPSSVTSPIRIGIDHDWMEVSVGATHSLALKTNGSLWAWGKNANGQVGDDAGTNQFQTSEILPGSRWKAISAGAFNSYALRNDGTVWGWGLDPITGGRNHDFTPRQIGNASNWLAIAAGDYHLVALQGDGTVWVHGQNAHVAAAKDASASVVAFVQIGTDTDWQEIYPGSNYEILRKSDGSWWRCGQDSNGGIQSDAPERMKFQFEPWSFAAGNSTDILLARDGTLWTWGERLGSIQSRNHIHNALAALQNLIFRRSASSFGPTPRVDRVPHQIWKLPATLRQPAGAAVKP